MRQKKVFIEYMIASGNDVIVNGGSCAFKAVPKSLANRKELWGLTFPKHMPGVLNSASTQVADLVDRGFLVRQDCGSGAIDSASVSHQ